MDSRKVGVRVALAVGVIAGMALLGGCAKKVEPKEAERKARLEKMEKEQYAAEKWMREGQYVPVPAEIRKKITQALDKYEALTSYRMGFYSQDGPVLVSMDGEVGDGNVHLIIQRSNEQYPWEGYLIGDRFYGQVAGGLVDHGPDSRAEGEKLYLPMYRDIRVSIGQSMNGEVKDVGEIPYAGGGSVHRYDFRVRVPDEQANLLTVTIDLDETLGLIRHLTLGQGFGSEASKQRFIKQYRECQFEKFGEVPPVQLPPRAQIKPPESGRDALDGTLGLE